jgi:DNA-binding SARP family transcriptional activator/tetratricopeptide (TPR) repeat protein
MFMFQILGPVRLSLRDHTADLGPAKVRGLLGVLLLSANAPIPIDHIVERLWDGTAEIGDGARPTKGREPPPNPAKTLQTYVSKLRAALAKVKAPATLLTEHGYYRLKVDPAVVDYHQFRQLADEGRTAARLHDHVRAVSAFAAAVALWRGRPLADVHSSWATRIGDSLVSQELMPAYYGLLDAHLALGHYDDVLTELGPLLVNHETDENLIMFRMRVLAAVDGPGSVTTCFRNFARKLRDMLDSDPSERLVRLYRQLTEQPAVVDEPSTVNVIRRPPWQLPRDLPHFVGRSDILHQLDALLANSDRHPAVVALDGDPGVGKTALAVHWAHRHRDHFADGALYADLNGYSPGTPTGYAAVIATFLDALGIPHDQISRDVPERAALLRQELAGRRVLVVLDNALDSAQVRPLLAATSPCPVLITSRQILSTLAYRDGAHSLTVPTLLVDEATALLQLRIGNSRVVRDLAAVYDLAALCSGLPLALQIAGEHVAARPDAPLAELVQHLRTQRRLLDAGSHGDDDSTTLRAVFDWSSNALDPDDDRLFWLLGVHPSTQVSTAAAAAVAGLSLERTEHVLDRLVGAHLTHQQGADVFRMHDLVHLHASDRARRRSTRDERRAAVHRMADWYLRTAMNAVRQISPQRKPVPPLDMGTSVTPQTFRDGQEALRWCIRERTQVLAISFRAAEYGFDHHVWRLVGTFDDILNRYGDPLVDVHRVALDAARITGARDGEAGSLNNLGVTDFYLGRFESAAHHYTQALAIFREIGDELGEAACLFNLGNTLIERGLYRKAIDMHEQSLVVAVRIGDTAGQARVYHRLGEAYQGLEQPVLAESYCRRALELRIQAGDVRGQAATLIELGELRVEAGDPEQAIALCARAIEISRDTCDQRKIAEALRTRASAYYRLGAHDESISAAKEAAELSQAMSDALGEARALKILRQARGAVNGSRETMPDQREKANKELLAPVSRSQQPIDPDQRYLV